MFLIDVALDKTGLNRRAIRVRRKQLIFKVDRNGRVGQCDSCYNNVGISWKKTIMLECVK